MKSDFISRGALYSLAAIISCATASLFGQSLTATITGNTKVELENSRIHCLNRFSARGYI